MSCCPPRVPGRPEALRPETIAPGHLAEILRARAVALPGGKFRMGTSDTILPEDGERPPRPKRIAPFRIAPTAVSNDDFAAFVAATGYRTEAERLGWSFVFDGHAEAPTGPGGAWWWQAVEGAFWAAPEGPGSGIEARGDHPVVHVSWNDAVAYARWAGGRLPTEAEWEYAASGGTDGLRFPWGAREPDDTAFTPCNIWQGTFPHTDTAADGYAGTAPVESFAPNDFGLFNTVGNVWEWTADVFRVRSLSRKTRGAAARNYGASTHRVLKGGSYLCHRSYCYRYRIAARSANTPDSSTGHMGFRLAFDA